MENCRRHVRKVHKDEGEGKERWEVEVDVDDGTRKAIRVRKLRKKSPD